MHHQVIYLGSLCFLNINNMAINFTISTAKWYLTGSGMFVVFRFLFDFSNFFNSPLISSITHGLFQSVFSQCLYVCILSVDFLLFTSSFIPL
jgi:hypothetical protein